MKNYRTKFHVAPLIFCFLLLACQDQKTKEEEKESSTIQEGVIEFNISYPYLQENSGYVNAIVPRTMTFTFKEGQFKSKISRGNMFGMVMIGKPSKDYLAMGLEFGTENIMADLSVDEIQQFKKSQPALTFKKTEDTTTMAGFLCKKSIATYQTDSSTVSFDVWYTEELEVNRCNWFTPYSSIDGVLMAYEVEYYGLRMRLEAESFEQKEINDDTFEVDRKFQNISYKKFDKRMHEIFNQLLSL